MSSENKITLISSDGGNFVVDESVALESEVVKSMMDLFGEVSDEPRSPIIPLENVCGKTLRKVIQFCEYHLEAQKISNEKPAVREKEIKQWDAEFVSVSQPELIDLILAAHYMDIPKLLHLTCQAAADSLKSKTLGEIRAFFNIQSDFTPQEEADLVKDYDWAF